MVNNVTAKKSGDFSEWYTQVIQKADLADYTDVSGCIVFKPRSYSIWERIRDETDKRFKKLGIQNVYFPIFIPEKTLSKEAEHVKGFIPEVAWVTHAGNTKLAERLAIRPTSETIMYESYAKWIRSWRDLPLKLNQWNNVVRWEFRHPIPFLRTREFLWNEGHTVYASKEEAEKEQDKIIGTYEDVCTNLLALPSMTGKKSKKETFAGAEYTISMEFVMPQGKAIQGPDFHHDGQKFAKAYNIKFLDEEGKEQYAWQNTFAITTRMLGIMIAVHSDDKGLVLPPRVAPTQVVIVPILFDDSKKKVLAKCKEVAKLLESFSVEVDDREGYTPGWKFNEWEMKGAPLRIELGPKDMEKDQAVLVRRDNGEKKPVKISSLSKEVPEMMDAIHDSLYKKAYELMASSLAEVETEAEFCKAIDNKKVAVTRWCGEPKCEEYVKEKTGAKSLNMPLKQPKVSGKCPFCKEPAKVVARFGRSY